MIPLSVPFLNGNEWKYVKDCLDTGWISSAGSYVTQFEQLVADYAGVKYGIACMNGTVGLHIAQILSGVTSEDHVIAPNITFIATLNAIKYTGASPILIDVDTRSWQMDLELLESFLQENVVFKEVDGQIYSFNKETNKRIKAIMPVHVLGNIGDMEQLQEIATSYHLDIIEDSTEALGSLHNGKHAGSFGKFGVFSFNGNKIISTGGGGVIVTNDEALAQKAKHLTTQAKVSAMEYLHDEVGYNYRLVNVLAAIGVAQMEQFPTLLENKKIMDDYYRSELSGIGDIEFQKKSMGKIKNVAGEGRTVLFVSHNMQAVQSLCKSAMYMKAGRVTDIGPTATVINNYLSREIRNSMERRWVLGVDAPGNDKVRLMSAEIVTASAADSSIISVNTAFNIKFEIKKKEPKIINCNPAHTSKSRIQAVFFYLLKKIVNYRPKLHAQN
jgi:dTDP-4-amino-4,6-dideoxygalactose transaminase